MMEAFVRGRDAAECEGRLRGARHNAANADLPRAELLAKLRASSASVGTPGEGVAQLGAYADAGVDEITAQFLVVDDFDGIHILGEESMPRLHWRGDGIHATDTRRTIGASGIDSPTREDGHRTIMVLHSVVDEVVL